MHDNKVRTRDDKVRTHDNKVRTHDNKVQLKLKEVQLSQDHPRTPCVPPNIPTQSVGMRAMVFQSSIVNRQSFNAFLV
jgi:hypothetical protein